MNELNIPSEETLMRIADATEKLNPDGKIGNLGDLKTDTKTNTVSAINEVKEQSNEIATNLTDYKKSNVHIGNNHKMSVSGWGAQSLESGVKTKLTLQSLLVGEAGFFNDSKIIVKETGVYLCHGYAKFHKTSTGAIQSLIYKNGVIIANVFQNNALYTGYDVAVQATALVELSVNDVIELYGAQFSGAASSVYGRGLLIVRVA